jgi:hypothetical protein
MTRAGEGFGRGETPPTPAPERAFVWERVVIDGAVPRSPRQRVLALMDFAEVALAQRAGRLSPPVEADVALRMAGLHQEIKMHRHDADWPWHEVEDDLCAVVALIVPPLYVVTVGEREPGDVLVREREVDE